MADARGGAVNCQDLQRVMREAPVQTHALTREESAHLEGCGACLEVWLDATVTRALSAKPKVEIPADFVARVVERLPAKLGTERIRESASRRIERHWGLLTAIVLVGAGLAATSVADANALVTRMGAIFMITVAAEVAGIALWLGTGRSGERHS
jgi:hypothetical protein